MKQHGGQSLLSKLKLSVADQTGSVAFEAIWFGLFMAFFLAPTTYLYQTTGTKLDTVWGQRLAARNEAVNDNCSGLVIPQLDFQVGVENSILSTITCAEEGGEFFDDENKFFWKSLDKAVKEIDEPIPDFVNPEMLASQINVYRGTGDDMSYRGLELGSGGGLLSVLSGFGSRTSAVLAPSTQYWVFDEDVWRAGHDAAVWSAFSQDATKLYPEVYPSKGGAVASGSDAGETPLRDYSGGSEVGDYID